MTDKTTTKLYQAGPRCYIYLQKSFLDDSTFPFKPNDMVDVKIDGDRLIVTKAKK